MPTTFLASPPSNVTLSHCTSKASCWGPAFNLFGVFQMYPYTLLNQDHLCCSFLPFYLRPSLNLFQILTIPFEDFPGCFWEAISYGLIWTKNNTSHPLPIRCSHGKYWHAVGGAVFLSQTYLEWETCHYGNLLVHCLPDHCALCGPQPCLLPPLGNERN